MKNNYSKNIVLSWRLLLNAGIFFLLIGCGESTSSKEEENLPTVPTTIYRAEASEAFSFVGVVTSFDSLRCSGVLLAHGLFVSAKHCFSANEESGASSLDNLKIIFPSENLVSDSDKKIQVTDIIYDTPLGEGNDIAYLIFDPAETSGLVELFSGEINTGEVLAPETKMTTVGFPSTSDKSLIKLQTHGCSRLDNEGVIGESAVDPGYDGTLYDTNCIAWKGNSGGGFFKITEEDGVITPLSLEGVVTHTFDLTDLGAIDPDHTFLDEFGNYVRTVNYSSFKNAVQLNTMLSAYQN